MTAIDNPDDTSGRLIAASKVSGTSVYNHQSEKLGSIYDVMLDKSSGKSEYAIMSFGGFLGVGERYHPIPWNQLTYSPSEGGYVVNLDRDRLEAAPSYEGNNSDLWSDVSWNRKVDDYYGPMSHDDLVTGPGGVGVGGLPPRL